MALAEEAQEGGAELLAALERSAQVNREQMDQTRHRRGLSLPGPYLRPMALFCARVLSLCWVVSFEQRITRARAHSHIMLGAVLGSKHEPTQKEGVPRLLTHVVCPLFYVME